MSHCHCYRNSATNSEVGTLRTVIVHSAGSSPTRPPCRRRNCHELLFDDVIWVPQQWRGRSSTPSWT